MRLIIPLLCLALCFSCKQDSKTTTAPEVTEAATSLSANIQEISAPVQGISHLPRLALYQETLHMTWVETQDAVSVLKYSKLDAETWTPAQTVTKGTNWFVNWADFPALSVNGDMMLTNVLQKSAEGTYDYDVKLSLFSPKGIKKGNFLLNTDGIAAEHGFVSMHAYDDGFFVSWLDGRNTKNEDETKNQMSVRNAFIDLDGNMTEDTEIDARVCDCCNTATAITLNGPVVVYRDRSEGELEIRDMSIVRWVDGAWTEPQSIHQDNWQLNGCPVNGPAIATQEEHMAVTWFTAAKDTPSVMVVFSQDNGATFNTPIRLDAGNAIGRVDISMFTTTTAVVSWLEPQGEDIVLQLAKVHADGRKEAPITVAKTSAKRQSGFPQLEVIGETAYVAWTDVDEEKGSKVRVMKVEL
ncbi:MAG: sialidase [Dokdonia sp.]|jgi:hypothetical protein|nr:sialidase [Dokdonia sp.]